jgi:predicted metal-dependent HD superfamily phosphohydrolase
VPAVTADERLVVDIDLAILAAAPARFAEYERQIREEYGFVPEDVFRAKRREVLQGFADRRPIYATPAVRDRLEAAAHANLARALSSSAAPAPSCAPAAGRPSAS